VLVQYCWQPQVVLEVSRSAFYPPPRVDSSCVRLTPWASAPVEVGDEPAFFALVKAAFGQRRKTLVNCLAPGRTPRRARVESLLSQLGLPPAVRGEALSLQQFAILANGLGSG
jgi:16S rRNA (adenine1518-N6/adenine1519-N6)-dimethyltransferase